MKSLERRLRAKNSGRVTKASGPSLTPDTACSDHQDPSRDMPTLDRPSQPHDASAGIHQPEPSNSVPQIVSSSPELGASGHGQSSSSQLGQLASATRHRSPGDSQISGPHVTVLDMLPGKSFASTLEIEALPPLPPDSRARALVDTVYFYTQARYCIVDWAKLREWHRDRESIAYTSTDGPIDSQTGMKFIWPDLTGNSHALTGAFFIWIIYAIGDCLVPNPESSTQVGALNPVAHGRKKTLNSTGIFLSCSSLPPGCVEFTKSGDSPGSLMFDAILFSRPGKRPVLSILFSCANVARLNLRYGKF